LRRGEAASGMDPISLLPDALNWALLALVTFTIGSFVWLSRRP
jgi:hypothetical protein